MGMRGATEGVDFAVDELRCGVHGGGRVDGGGWLWCEV